MCYYFQMRDLILGIVFIVIVGVGGLVYRNAVEHPSQPIACPMDARVCPDGTSVGRTGSTCTFSTCPLPNVSIDSVGISFAIPAGFGAGDLFDTASIATYEQLGVASSSAGKIIIRRYTLGASTTALAMIQKTAIDGTSGLPMSMTSFSSSVLGGHRFTVVTLNRFEGVIDTAYYLARANDVLRFDAIDMGVTNWTDERLDISKLPTQSALVKLLSTLEGQ